MIRLLRNLVIFILIGNIQHLKNFLFIRLIEIGNESKQLLLVHVFELVKNVSFALICKKAIVFEEQIDDLVQILLSFRPLFVLRALLVRNHADCVLLVYVAVLAAERVDQPTILLDLLYQFARSQILTDKWPVCNY